MVSTMPHARMSFGTVSLAQGILLVGGDDSSGPLSTADLFDPATGVWQRAPPLNHPRWGLTAVSIGNIVYAIGGFETSSSVDWVEAWDSGADAGWEDLSPMPTPRWGLSAALGQDGRIYAIGGLGGFSGTGLSTVEAYTPGADGGFWE
jgi:kelch-like protein 2/3